MFTYVYKNKREIQVFEYTFPPCSFAQAYSISQLVKHTIVLWQEPTENK